MHGELDVIILSHTVEDPELECLQLFTDRILMALPASVAIAGRVGRNLLSKVRLLVLEEGHCLRDQVLDYCKRHQMGKIDTLGASNLTTLTQMVSHGLGATMLPELCAYTETRRRHIRLTRLPAPEPKRELHLVWRVASPRRRDYVELRKLLLAARPKMPSVSRH
jgi:LysR family hydrogen peroxide-inducible transcriptional activator